MNFKIYDILSSLIPGFTVLLAILFLFGYGYKPDFAIGYTAFAFLIGYLINTISSWMEQVFFWTWGGNPATRLLEGGDTWKVRFYDGCKIKAMLAEECKNQTPTNSELFAIAMRHANAIKSSRIEDFIANYAFSRAILTTILVVILMVVLQDYCNFRLIVLLVAALVISWLRCKQRSYYYCREVLNTYLHSKNNS